MPSSLPCTYIFLSFHIQEGSRWARMKLKIVPPSKNINFPPRNSFFCDEDDLSRATKTSFSDDSDAFTRKMFNSCCWFLVKALLGVEIGHGRWEKVGDIGLSHWNTSILVRNRSHALEVLSCCRKSTNARYVVSPKRLYRAIKVSLSYTEYQLEPSAWV